MNAHICQNAKDALRSLSGPWTNTHARARTYIHRHTHTHTMRTRQRQRVQRTHTHTHTHTHTRRTRQTGTYEGAECSILISRTFKQDKACSTPIGTFLQRDGQASRSTSCIPQQSVTAFGSVAGPGACRQRQNAWTHSQGPDVGKSGLSSQPSALPSPDEISLWYQTCLCFLTVI